MINQILESISMALNQEFGDTYTIYMEEVKQGLTEPCFFVFCLNPSCNLYFNKKYFRENLFCIQYIPATEEVKEECNAVAERMLGCLEVLSAEKDKFRGSRMNFEVVDNVLNFYVNYNFFVYRLEGKEMMDSISETINAKG